MYFTKGKEEARCKRCEKPIMTNVNAAVCVWCQLIFRTVDPSWLPTYGTTCPNTGNLGNAAGFRTVRSRQATEAEQEGMAVSCTEQRMRQNPTKKKLTLKEKEEYHGAIAGKAGTGGRPSKGVTKDDPAYTDRYWGWAMVH